MVKKEKREQNLFVSVTKKVFVNGKTRKTRRSMVPPIGDISAKIYLIQMMTEIQELVTARLVTLGLVSLLVQMITAPGQVMKTASLRYKLIYSLCNIYESWTNVHGQT